MTDLGPVVRPTAKQQLIPKPAFLFEEIAHPALPARYSHSKLYRHMINATLKFLGFIAISAAGDVGVFFVFLYVTPDITSYAWWQQTSLYALVGVTVINCALFNDARQCLEHNLYIAHIHQLGESHHPVLHMTFVQQMLAAMPFDEDLEILSGERIYTKSFPDSIEVIVRIFGAQRTFYVARVILYYIFACYDFWENPFLYGLIYLGLTAMFALYASMGVILNFLRPSSGLYSNLRRR